MSKENLEKQLSESLKIATPWVYITVIPVTILAFIFSFFIMSWKYGLLIAQVVEYWHEDRSKKKEASKNEQRKPA